MICFQLAGISYLPSTIVSTFHVFLWGGWATQLASLLNSTAGPGEAFCLPFYHRPVSSVVFVSLVGCSCSPWPLSKAYPLLKHASATTASSLSTFLAICDIRFLLLHSESSLSWSASRSTYLVRSHTHKATYSWSCCWLSSSTFNLICGENL